MSNVKVSTKKAELEKEIKNAKNQYEVMDVVDKFDDSTDLDLADDIYSESDMVMNIDNMDDYHEPKDIKDKSKYSKNQLQLWEADSKILDRLANDDYPKDNDMYFYEDGDPVSVADLQQDALDMLDEDM